jgi:large subunit ribosomal protein L23
MDKHQIILGPVETEKSAQAQENNIYTFWVHKQADKNQVKEAFEQLFGVQPKKVRTMIMPGKPKRIWRQNRYVYSQSKKKALIQLGEKDKVDLTKIK